MAETISALHRVCLSLLNSGLCLPASLLGTVPALSCCAFCLLLLAAHPQSVSSSCFVERRRLEHAGEVFWSSHSLAWRRGKCSTCSAINNVGSVESLVGVVENWQVWQVFCSQNFFLTTAVLKREFWVISSCVKSLHRNSGCCWMCAFLGEHIHLKSQFFLIFALTFVLFFFLIFFSNACRIYLP